MKQCHKPTAALKLVASQGDETVFTLAVDADSDTSVSVVTHILNIKIRKMGIVKFVFVSRTS